MAVPADFVPSLADLQARAAAHFRTRFPTKAHDRDSYFGKHTRALSMALLGFIKRLATVARNQVPGYDNDLQGASAWGDTVGIPSNNPNSRYGPNVARPAAGGVGTASGTPGSPIADGTDLVDSTGQVFFKTSGLKTIGAGGTIGVDIVAVTPGKAGNLDAGNILQFVSAPAGVQQQVQLTTGLGGGDDDEQRDSIVDRTLRNLRNGKRGGTSADFRRWAENYLTAQGIPGGLVKRAWPYPLRGGVGTMHLVIGGAGSGLSRLLTQTVADAVTAFINLMRPPCSQLKVLLPDMSRPGRSIVTHVLPNAARKYQFDTLDFSLLVSSVPTSTQIVVNTNIATDLSPGVTSLRAAIDGGKKPRLQIQSANSVLPLIVRAISYTNAASSTINLEAAPAVAIVPTDRVRAGSEVVLPIAQAIKDFVDNLGPSTQSGYADPFDAWTDSIGIGAIEGIAMAATDPTDPKAKLIGDVGGTTIDGGTSTVRARDVLVGGTPELLYLAAGGILILPL